MHTKLALLSALVFAGSSGAATSPPAPAVNLANPVLFVTQVPIEGFGTITSVFANHRTSMQEVARGGDLWIRYPDGTLRNLTAEAGFGNDGMQGPTSIAVRDPVVDWSGTKALFSMLIGAPADQYDYNDYYWQIYEITGFGQGQTVSITLVPGQEADVNNVEPIYASDGNIIFSSDRSRTGERHLYPQLDEYESTPTPTGIWKLDRSTNALTLLEHAVSGSFHASIDSFGRVIFTRWDHLQQDQQAENPDYGTFNWTSEAANAQMVPSVDVFPEPRYETSTAYGHVMNQFFPWMMNQDGSGEETINHIGRHELVSYFNMSLKNDPSLHDFSPGDRFNQNDTENWLQIREDPTTPGRYVAIDAPEFYTDSAGQIISITAPPGLNASQMAVTYLTPQSTREFYDGENPPADFTGHYRNPLPMTDGQMIASYDSNPGGAENIGSRSQPESLYKFRLYRLHAGNGGYMEAASADTLTPGISKSVSYWDPDVLVTYNGPLWELNPVEVHARTVPPATAEPPMQSREAQAFDEAHVAIDAFTNFMAARSLGVLVGRNATTRDQADQQQPYNLRVPGGVETLGNNGIIYDIQYMQVFQADQVRGEGGTSDPREGRRPLAEPLHDAQSLLFMPPLDPAAPPGAVRIASDGSFATVVPAERAMVWQSTTADGTPVVRERYWISVKPGEVRACPSCHGVNTVDQSGQPPAQNLPVALVNLVVYWRDHYDTVFDGNFEPH